MNLQLAYLGRSAIRQTRLGLSVSLAPNPRRDRVGFSGTLWHPLRFREAVSALHDIVVSDLRYQPKDRSAYQAFLAEQKERENALRRGARQAARAELLSRQPEPMPPGLEQRFKQLRETYWDARLKYSDYLSRHDPELWRMLVPCDPVITVAPDVLFFECFSKDESSYGCLTVERNAFTTEEKVALGTTNVDYSWTLYEEFQKLRSYRSTRFVIDPAGFEVQTAQQANYREEKIDLPSSWLRGFLQLQAAMSLPMRRVPVSREGLYNVLAWLKRHRAARSPRAVRFELEPGQPVVLVLEPWERRIVLHGTPYAGARETIRVWGRDRLRVLARLLPLAEGADVYLLGTGLPSFWSVKMGEMRLLLGLSGWTANDWTGAGALDQLMPPLEPSADLLGDVAAVFKDGPALTFGQIQQPTGGPKMNNRAGKKVSRVTLNKMYTTQGMTIRATEKSLGLKNVHRLLVRFGINRRPPPGPSYHPKINPSDQEKAYAAGFFDGEGCILIRLPGKHSGHILLIRLTQSRRNVLEWVKERWGGFIVKVKEKAGRRRVWVWNACSSQALKFLQDTHPFLIVKKEESKIAIDFQIRKKNTGPRDSKANRKTDEESREKLIAIRTENQKT